MCVWRFLFQECNFATCFWHIGFQKCHFRMCFRHMWFQKWHFEMCFWHIWFQKWQFTMCVWHVSSTSTNFVSWFWEKLSFYMSVWRSLVNKHVYWGNPTEPDAITTVLKNFVFLKLFINKQWFCTMCFAKVVILYGCLNAIFQKARVFSSGEPHGTVRNLTRMERALSYGSQNPMMLARCMFRENDSWIDIHTPITMRRTQ